MKDYLQLLAAFVVILALIPCIGYADKKSTAEKASGKPTEEVSVKLLDLQTDEIKTLDLKSYIVGAVFAQMPADFEQEALNAQAVLASTYAKRRILSEENSPTKSLKGAHLSTDQSKYQAYFTEEQAKSVYGEDYEAAYEKISAAAEYAKRLTLTYEGEPILVAFHGVSFGCTESSLSMWGTELAYLQSVESAADADLPESVQQVGFSEQEMRSLLEGEFSDISLSDDPSEWISPAELTQNGTVLKVSVGGRVFDSERLCALLGLQSRHFTAEYEGGNFSVTAKGCGHLVGMSQYGANEMAKSGESCEDILLHYFKGTSLVKDG